MAQLRQDYDQFVARDTVIMAIGPESPESFQKYWQENDLPFIGLPDPEHSVLKQYGQEVKLFKMGRLPAQMLIDKNSQVRYVHYGKNMSDIPENAELLGLLDNLSQDETQSQ